MQNYCRQQTIHIDIYFTRSFILYQLNDVTRMKKMWRYTKFNRSWKRINYLNSLTLLSFKVMWEKTTTNEAKIQLTQIGEFPSSHSSGLPSEWLVLKYFLIKLLRLRLVFCKNYRYLEWKGVKSPFDISDISLVWPLADDIPWSTFASFLSFRFDTQRY